MHAQVSRRRPLQLKARMPGYLDLGFQATTCHKQRNFLAECLLPLNYDLNAHIHLRAASDLNMDAHRPTKSAAATGGSPEGIDMQPRHHARVPLQVQAGGGFSYRRLRTAGRAGCKAGDASPQQRVHILPGLRRRARDVGKRQQAQVLAFAQVSNTM